MLRKWRALIISSLLLLFLIGVGVVCAYRFTLGLRTIAIQGNRFVTQDEIRRSVGPFQGLNAVVLSVTGRLDRKIKRDLPKVADVESDYKWPYAIQVTIKEKKPWVVFVSDTTVVIASDGTVLARINSDAVTPLPTEVVALVGMNQVYFSGSRVNPYVLNTITPLVQGIRNYFPDQPLQVELKGLIVTNTMATMEELVLFKDQNIPIFFGPEQDFLTKLSALRQFLWYIGIQESTKPIQYIDLRVPDKVIVGYGT